MEVFIDCLPCVLKQVIEAARMATDNVEIHEEIIGDSIKVLSDYKHYSCSPDISLVMHQIVKKHTGMTDPYALIKKRDIDSAKKVYPLLNNFLQTKDSSLYWVLKMAATGNIIDSALYSNLDLENCIEAELDKEFAICDIEFFEERLKSAKNLLIIGDNAGETVFDKALIENLPFLDITYAVRNEPIINDATIEDAYASGLNDCAKIISTGFNAPGAILEKCSKEFLNIFNRADVVISKGQGNYEALSDCSRDIFFLLKAKCVMISQKFGVRLNEYVFKYNVGNKMNGVE